MTPVRLPAEIRSVLKPLYACCAGTCPCGWPFDPSCALIPRIMFGAYNGIENVRYIVVGKNPGNPNAEEASFYADPSNGDSLIDRQAAWGQRCHLNRPFGRDSRYHTTLMRFLRALLKVETDQQVLNVVYFTEGVKCTNPLGEQRSISSRHFDKCMELFLLRELYVLPKVPIIALGREVERALFRLVPERTILYLSHPTYGWRASYDSLLAEARRP